MKIVLACLCFTLMFPNWSQASSKKNNGSSFTTSTSNSPAGPTATPTSIVEGSGEVQPQRDCVDLLSSGPKESLTFWQKILNGIFGGPEPKLKSTPQSLAEKRAAEKEANAVSTSSFWGPRPSSSSSFSSSSFAPSSQELARKEKEAKAKMLVKIKEMLSEKKAYTPYVQEAISLEWLGIAAKKEGRWSVGVYLDRPGATLNDGELGEIKDLAEHLKKTNWLVLYDGEAPSAAIFSKILGERSIGIVSSSQRSLVVGGAPVLVVRNPYLRMEAFHTADKVVVGAGSLVGAASILRGKANYFYSFEKKEYRPSGDAWAPNFKEPSLGFKVSSVDSSMNASSLGKLESRSSSTTVFANSFDEQLEVVSSKTIDEAISLGRNLIKGVGVISESEGQKILDGAVVFGSGSYPGEYTEPIYAAVRWLADQGMAITTGGANGVMEIANAAAWDAGAPSIGIPMGSGFKLSSEKETASSLQSVTFDATGYEARIPLLLHRKSLVIVAPGGTGTIKEIATWLIHASSMDPSHRTAMIFFGAYYENTVAQLQKLLPPEVMAGVFLAKDQKELAEVVTELKAKFWTPEQVSALFPKAAPKARNANASFFLEKPEASSLRKPKGSKEHKGLDDDWGMSWD